MRVRDMPVDDKYTQKDLIRFMLYDLKNDERLKVPYHRDKIYLNEKTLRIILQCLSNIIEYFLNENPILDGHKSIIQPFHWLRLYAYDEPDKPAINNITKQQYLRKGRRRYKANMPVYHQRKWNNL